MIKLILFILITSSVFLYTKEITVGVYDMYPASFKDKDGEIKGIYIDVINDVAKCNKWNVRYHYSTFNELINLLRNGKIDLVPGLVKTEERIAFFDFSNETLLSGWSSFNYNKKFNIKSIKDIDDKIIGLIKNDVNNEVFLELLLDSNVSPSIKYFNEFSDMLPEIRNGFILGGIFRNFYTEWEDPENIIISSAIKFPINESYFCVPKGKNKDLLEAIDQEIHLWKQDKNSIYYTSINKWINQDTDYSRYIVIIALLLIFSAFTYFLYRIYKKRNG